MNDEPYSAARSRTITAVLPLKIFGWVAERRSEDLERSDILLTSLERFAEPGLVREIVVVVPSRDERAVRSCLLRFTTIPLKLICEDDILPQLRHHPEISGWQRQQLIKLGVATAINAEFYLTLDADVVLCKPLAYDHLVVDGKALIEPESRTTLPLTDWWHRSSEVLGLPTDLSAPGMAVTPALLSPAICKQLFTDLECRFRRNWADVLLEQPGWSEYTLYYLTAERHGMLDKFHTLPAVGGRRLICSSSVWIAPSFENWNAAHCFGEDDPGLFAVIQSRAGVSARKLRNRLRPYLRARRPTWREKLARMYWRWRFVASPARPGRQRPKMQ